MPSKKRILAYRKASSKTIAHKLLDAVKAVAEELGENYVAVEIVMSPNSYYPANEQGITFRGYINASTWVNGITIDEVCTKLREEYKGPGKKQEAPLPYCEELGF